VGRPDVLGEPDAGVVDADARGRQPGRDVGEQQGRVERDRGVDGGRDAVRAQPRAHERGVVVAGNDDDLPVLSEARADRLQNGPRPLERAAPARGRKLDRVAEEHEPVDVLQGRQQSRQRLGPAQHVAPDPGAEVQVRDDERAHRGATLA
jgi:hypothetical protein